MKIIVIIGINPFFDDYASANRWRTLLEGLSDLGNEIQILIYRGYNSRDEYIKMDRKGQIGNIKCEYLNFLFHHTLFLRRLNNYLLSPLTRPLVNRNILKKVEREPHAIVWTGGDLDSFRLVLKLRRRYPKQKTFLELSEFIDIHHYNKGLLVHRKVGDKRHSLFESKAFYAYDGLALMTQTLMKHYERKQNPGPKLIHLPMTVDLERFGHENHAPKEFEKPYMSFVGMMNNNKEGIDILIKAFAKITDEFPAFKLYLIGPWHYDTPEHQNLIKLLKLEKRIILVGKLKRDEIPAVIKNATLLLLPRPDSRQAQGGFPTKLGEYLATGNPVCATSVGELPDYLADGESVYFAEPGSVDSFAGAIRRALSNPVEARNIGLNGRKVAEMFFNKDVQAKKLNDFLLNHL